MKFRNFNKELKKKMYKCIVYGKNEEDDKVFYGGFMVLLDLFKKYEFTHHVGIYKWDKELKIWTPIIETY